MHGIVDHHAPRILLIQPPVRDFYTTEVRLQPLGLAYLKAAIQKEYPEAIVKISDHHGGGKKRRTVSLPPELSHLRRVYAVDDRSPFSSFFQFYHFGSSPDEIEVDVRNFSPDLIGISSLFSAYYDQVLETARAVKRVTSAPVVCGGTHATVHPESLLAEDSIDFVIRGEGESPIIALIRALMGTLMLDQAGGLVYKKNEQLIYNSSSDTSELWKDLIPDYSDFSPETYLYEKTPLAFLQVSRGCPASCSFCSVHPVFGKKHRRRAIQSVLEEMEVRYRSGVRVFDFEDDNLTFSKSYALELFRSIAEQFGDRPIRLHAMNGIYYPKLDREILLEMKRAGFTELNLSYVSQDEKIRSLHQRNTGSSFVPVVEEANEIGFRVTAYLILGLPGEDLSSIKTTLTELASLPVLIGASPFYATPGMPLTAGRTFHREALLRGRLTAMESGGSLSTEDLHTLFVIVRMINYIKSAPVRETGLKEALAALERNSTRNETAVELLRTFLKTGTIYYQVPGNQKKERPGLNAIGKDLIEEIRLIRGREGQKIFLPVFGRKGGS